LRPPGATFFNRRLQTRNEITRVFEGDLLAKFPPILSPGKLADLLGLSVKTVHPGFAPVALNN
jgi:hypothetical protein